MRLYIPDIGDTLWLTEDWSFPLYDERRNEGLVKIVQPDYLERRPQRWRWYGDASRSYSCVLPSGTELTVARVYIRNGQEDYSSLTFRIGHCPNKAMRKKRFWAKLADVNRIEFVNQATVK